LSLDRSTKFQKTLANKIINHVVNVDRVLVWLRSFGQRCPTSPSERRRVGGAHQGHSGKMHRHRLNRGGDRQANNALWSIAMVRMRSEPQDTPPLSIDRDPGTDCSDFWVLRCVRGGLAVVIQIRVRHDGRRTSAWSVIDVVLHHIQKFINFVG
jgi:hypothetical protein